MKLLASVMVLLVASCASSSASVGIKVLQDFEAGFRLTAGEYPGITTAISRETEFGQACLKVTVAKGFDWRLRGTNGLQDAPLDAAGLATISGPYLPPEADAVRMRIRVASGRGIIAVGGPVSQIGNSDVWR